MGVSESHHFLTSAGALPRAGMVVAAAATVAWSGGAKPADCADNSRNAAAVSASARATSWIRARALTSSSLATG